MNKKKTQSKTKSRTSSDNLCKLIAEEHPKELVEWLMGIKVGECAILKTELSREPVRADSIILIAAEGFILHVEFQTTVKSNPPIDLRMLDYFVALRRQFLCGEKIKQVLVVLNDVGEKVPERFEGEGWFFPFHVVKLWAHNENELLKYDGLKPLAVLCGKKTNGEKLLTKVAAKLNEIEDLEERSKQIDMARVFAGLRFKANMIYELLLGGDMLEESVIVQDWLRRGRKEGIEKGIEKGIEEGLEKGREEGERLLLVRLLTKRFGRLPVKTKTQIESLSLKQIEKLSEALLDFKEKSELNTWLEKHSREVRADRKSNSVRRQNELSK